LNLFIELVLPVNYFEKFGAANAYIPCNCQWRQQGEARIF
jgi:hypothetical protein